MAFRIGVTGTVRIDESQRERIRDSISAVLRDIKSYVGEAANSEEANQFYQQSTVPVLSVISPLAEGADRIVAREAIDLEINLNVILPFATDEYEQTFAGGTYQSQNESILEFRELLSLAEGRVLTLDGGRGDLYRARSYEAVGRAVVRNCDLVIAIWNHLDPPKGLGGTSDTIHFALKSGVPVWWINAGSCENAVWLVKESDLPDASCRPDVVAAGCADSLRGYIIETLLPPIGQNESDMRRERQHKEPGLLGYMSEKDAPNRNYWRLHEVSLRALRRIGGLLESRSAIGDDPPRSRSADPARLGAKFNIWGHDTAYSSASSRASALSSTYRQRYRTSYMLVFVLGAAALIAAITGLAYPKLEPTVLWGEAFALLGILVLVLVNHHRRWHERYISYRMLGELLRASTFLRPMARGVPGGRVANLTKNAKRGWVAWVFSAMTRAIPMTNGYLSSNRLNEIRGQIVSGPLQGQIHFHRTRYVECRGASRILSILGSAFFVVTILLVAIRLGVYFTSHDTHLMHSLSFFSALLPAVSAAFFGLRAYEELESLSEQSLRMHSELIALKDNILSVNVNDPLASIIVGNQIAEAVSLMLSDVEGWAQLFRLKPVESQ